MARTVYPSLIDTVSTNIDIVGGKNAELYDIRGEPGKDYMLVQAVESIANNLIVYLISNTVYIADSTSIWPLGVNTTGKTIAADYYFWVQISGVADVECDDSVDQGEGVMTSTGGIGTAAIPTSVADSYTLGYAITSDTGANTNAKVLIDRGFNGANS